jgi:hypothetical protein
LESRHRKTTRPACTVCARRWRPIRGRIRPQTWTGSRRARRGHGAASDNLLSAHIVTANARILPVDAERNPDLLWALRGAGANFGVTRSFECRLNSIGPVTFGDIFHSLREARPVLRLFRSLMAEAPDSFQAALNLTTGERGVFIRLCHAGEEAEAARLLRAFRTVATPVKDTVSRGELAQLAGGVPTGGPDTSFRCIATVYRNELSDEVMEMALDRFSEAPPETNIGIDHYMHGEVLPRNARLKGSL